MSKKQWHEMSPQEKRDWAEKQPTVGEMARDLQRLGWVKAEGFSAYRSPDGLLYPGPYVAWCVATMTSANANPKPT